MIPKYLGAPVVLLALACGSLAGCGGGGGVADDAVGSGVGQLTQGSLTAGGPVAGVVYETASQNGVTDADGAFTYRIGEVISFSIGNTQLGATITALSTVTPLELIPGASIPIDAADVRAFLATSDEERARGETQHLANLIAFLLSLDHDNDASNGIQIDAAQANLVDDIELGQSFEAFASQARQSLHAAYDQGLRADARVASWAAALDFLAAARGVTPEVFIRSVTSVDSNADGQIDRVTTRTQDGRQRTTGWVTDNGADGTPDAQFTLLVDTHGDIARDSYDNQGDGIADSITDYARNVHGQVILESQDSDADGSADRLDRTTYDTLGNPTRVESDVNADGRVDRIRTRRFDAQGRVVYDAYDGNADGTPNRVTTYAFTDTTSRVDIDDNADGTPEVSTTTVFDTAGVKLSSTITDMAGQVIGGGIYTYDAAGNLTLFDSHVPGETVSYTYDSNGRLTLERYDTTGDGLWDEINTLEYDTEGNLLRFLRDSNGNGTPTSITTMAYDSHGNRIFEADDRDGDGEAEEWLVFGHDAYGNVVERKNFIASRSSTDPAYIETATHRITTFEDWVRFRNNSP